MKESYITKNFKKTAAARFPVQAEQLNAAFYARLQALRQDNAGATKEKQRHLENQILPGIAAYEALQKARILSARRCRSAGIERYPANRLPLLRRSARHGRRHLPPLRQTADGVVTSL